MQQLSMFDLMMPPPPPVVARVWTPPPTREFVTRAYGEDYIMEIRLDEREPIEMEVRGILTVIRFDYGFSTYVIQPPGALYWSETGFRSFTNTWTVKGPELTGDDVRQMIDANIDSKHGCNDKLVPWWPFYALQWRQNKAFADRYKREDLWAQWGEEAHAEHWANYDAKQAAAIAEMQANGIDPEAVWRSR